MSMTWVGRCYMTYSTLKVRLQVNHLLPLGRWDHNHISGWDCILMTTGHSRSCWNTIYIYQVDLLWVWSGWDVSIISYSTLLVRLQVNHLPLPLWLWDWWDQAYIRVTSLWLPAAVDSEGVETLLYIWTRPVMSMNWVGCLNHNIHLNPSETPSESPTAISRWGCILMTTSRSSRC